MCSTQFGSLTVSVDLRSFPEGEAPQTSSAPSGGFINKITFDD